MKERIKHLILFLIIIGTDQGVKYWVRHSLMNQEPLVIIPKVLNLQYHENTGAAWGIMSGKTQLLSIFTIFVSLLIIYIYFKIPQTRKNERIKDYCCVCSGRSSR